MPNTLTARAIDEALKVDAKLERLIALITDHRAARIKEAQQLYTAKTGGALARLETEYRILKAVEDIFQIDTSDACMAVADECQDECGYDIETSDFTDEVPVEDFGASHPDAGRFVARVLA